MSVKKGLAGRWLAAPLLAVGLWAVLMPASGTAATLYRYINERGFQEIGYSIPPHLVPNGYDEISDLGRLIRRVPPQLTEEEYAAKLERERRMEACEKALDRVTRLYESLDDIDKAELLYEKKRAESRRNDEANLEFTASKLRDLQDSAAQLEREGKQISGNFLESITRAENRVQTLSLQLTEAEGVGVARAREFDEERLMFEIGECNPDRLATAQRITPAKDTAEL